MTDIFQLYADSMANENVDVPYNEQLDKRMFWTLPILFERDSRQGKSTYHHRVIEILDTDPIDLFFWITEDEYEKRDPSADAPVVLPFPGDVFFSYDPWVKQAVADFRKRGGKNQPIDPQSLHADIRQFERAGPMGLNPHEIDWQRVPTVWRVAACVDQLIKERKLADAEEIARIYDRYVSIGNDKHKISIARELRRRVSTAQHAN